VNPDPWPRCIKDLRSDTQRPPPNYSVADPDSGSGAFLTPGSGMGKYQDPGSGSGSGMNNPDHISESLETIFWVKILKCFDADPGSGMENIRIRDKHPGSARLPNYIYYFILCLELTRVGEAEAAAALTPRRLSKRSDTSEWPLTPSRRGEGPLTPSRRSEGPLTPSRRSRRLSSSLGGTDQQLLHLAPDGGVITRGGSLVFWVKWSDCTSPNGSECKKKIYAFLG
jgi:hypothetical protein